MTPRTKTVAWASARATDSPLHLKNTAFFNRRNSASHCQPTFVPRVNYLRITGLKVGVILNFTHARLEWERIIP